MDTREVAEVRRDGATRAHVAPFAVVGFDRALRIIEWNALAAELLGVATGAALGRDVAEVLPLAGGEASWRDLLVEREGAAPVRLKHADGRLWEWSPALVRDRAGRPDGVVCYGREVTAQAAVEYQREVEHAMLRVIVDNLPVVVCAYAHDGLYLAVEGKGLEAAGLVPAQFAGVNPLVAFAHSDEATRFIREGLAGVPTRAVDIEMFDHTWESWHIPAPPGGPVALVSVSLNTTESRRREQDLLATIEQIERQQQMIRELSTPIIEVWEGVLALPILGLVDSVRTAEIMDNLLQSVGRMRARFAILDMTGVEVVDTATANSLISMIRAIRLLGAEGVITGIHPNIAQTVVTLGVELRGISVFANLRQALKYCIGRSPAARAQGPAAARRGE